MQLFRNLHKTYLAIWTKYNDKYNAIAIAKNICDCHCLLLKVLQNTQPASDFIDNMQVQDPSC